MTVKDVYTTGQAAKICQISQQTIIRCFDNGTLKGFKVPGSRFRRIPRAELKRFMEAHRIPTDRLDQGAPAALLYGPDDPKFAHALATLAKASGLVFEREQDIWELKLKLFNLKPAVVIMDLRGVGEQTQSYASRIASTAREQADSGTSVILVAIVDDRPLAASLQTEKIVNDVFFPPFDPELAAERTFALYRNANPD